MEASVTYNTELSCIVGHRVDLVWCGRHDSIDRSADWRSESNLGYDNLVSILYYMWAQLDLAVLVVAN